MSLSILRGIGTIRSPFRIRSILASIIARGPPFPTYYEGSVDDPALGHRRTDANNLCPSREWREFVVTSISFGRISRVYTSVSSTELNVLRTGSRIVVIMRDMNSYSRMQLREISFFPPSFRGKKFNSSSNRDERNNGRSQMRSFTIKAIGNAA